jgi:hypothetical protein
VGGTEDDVQARANVAAALALFGQAEIVWPALNYGPDPRLRTSLIRRLATGGTPPDVIIDELTELLRQPKDDDAGLRQALVLYLGRFTEPELPNEYERLPTAGQRWTPELRGRATNELLAAYANDPDPGVHSAIDWTLRRRYGDRPILGTTKTVRMLDEELSRTRTAAEVVKRLRSGDFSWRWYLTPPPHLHTMVVVDPRRWKAADLRPGLPSLQHAFAISTKEVTFDQYERFMERPQVTGRAPGRPVQFIKWQSAYEYCDRLSAAEGPAGDKFFEAAGEGDGRGTALAGAPGYRLPSEAEWEYACRAGTRTKRFFGDSDSGIREYAWYRANSANNKLREERVAGPVGSFAPNQLGLFDTYGNVAEYCIANPFVKGSSPAAVRGGWFENEAGGLHSETRTGDVFPSPLKGFRVARTLPTPSKVSQAPP